MNATGFPCSVMGSCWSAQVHDKTPNAKPNGDKNDMNKVHLNNQPQSNVNEIMLPTQSTIDAKSIQYDGIKVSNHSKPHFGIFKW